MSQHPVKSSFVPFLRTLPLHSWSQLFLFLHSNVRRGWLMLTDVNSMKPRLLVLGSRLLHVMGWLVGWLVAFGALAQHVCGESLHE